MNEIDIAQLDGGKKLPIVEQFYSIQGEGGNSGKAAYFVRLAGCNVGCKWCDAKESWNRDKHPAIEVDEIIKNVQDSGAINVIITGGEPLLYPLDYITSELKKIGVSIMLETSGSSKFSGVFDWVCLSPKRKLKPLEASYKLCTELKVVVEDTQQDLKWALECASYVSESTLLYLQPEWSKMEDNLPAIIEFAKSNPRWMVSLQTHKFMKIL